MNNVEIKRANESTGVWDRDEYRKAEYTKSIEQTEKTSGKSLEEMVDDLLRAVGFDMDLYDDGTFELNQDVKTIDNQIKEDVNKRLTSELKLASISEIEPKLRTNIGQL